MTVTNDDVGVVINAVEARNVGVVARCLTTYTDTRTHALVTNSKTFKSNIYSTLFTKPHGST